MNRAICGLCLLLAAVLALAGCGGGSSTALDEQKKESYAQEFMQELRNEILPYRNDPDTLYERGLMVAGKDDTRGLEYLSRFYQSYSDGEDWCQVTIAFADVSPLVVTRVVFAGDSGYYFRYELDESENIAVTGRYLDQAEVTTDREAGKIYFRIKNGKNQLASFTFLMEQGEAEE